MTSPPTLRSAGALADALTRPALAALNGEPLLRFLETRRWYGEKARDAHRATIAGLVPVERGADGASGIVFVDVDFAEQPSSRYVLPLAVRPAVATGEPSAVIATLVGGTQGVLLDATADERFRGALLELIVHGHRLAGDGAEVIGVPLPSTESTLGRASIPSRLLAAEQSNSSLLYGDVAVLKLFRRLESGVSPEVEIGRFLTTSTDFGGTPRQFGALHAMFPDRESAYIGVLQAFVVGATDGWRFALEQARRVVAGSSRRAQGPDGAQSDGVAPFTADAERLGATTRQLHEALATADDVDGFAPRAAGKADVETWAARTRDSIRGAMSLLERRLAARAVAPPQAAAASTALLRRQEQILSQVSEHIAALGDPPTAGKLVRHHGDFHLGQVLHEPNGTWWIIDFEGEPSRTLDDRRALDSPLRDVAGMLRSFAYASATAVSEAAGSAVVPEVEVRAGRWERDVRAAFLAGYFAQPISERSPLPEAESSRQSLIALFELEKLFYELNYELNNRPDWVWIPLRGIAKLF